MLLKRALAGSSRLYWYKMLFAIVISIIAVARPAVSSRTFLPGRAYLEYPKWAAALRGRVEFYFKTSKMDGTLLHVDSLHLKLDRGMLNCSVQLDNDLVHHQTFGKNLNDDRWYKIDVIKGSFDLKIEVDGKKRFDFNDAHLMQFSKSIYIGGVPPSVISQDYKTSFQGCIKNVKASNHSTHKFLMKTMTLLSQNMTVTGCLDPCEMCNSTCHNGGRCIGDWSNNQVKCICPPPFFGQRCLQKMSKASPQIPAVTVKGHSYYCYSIETIKEPYIPPLSTVYILPPIPANGVVMSYHGKHHSAALYLDNYKPIYMAYNKLDCAISKVEIDIVLSRNRSYTLSVLSEERLLKMTVQTNNTLHESTTSLQEYVENQNELICIGGGFIEVKPYNGHITGAIYQSLSISSQDPVIITSNTRTYIPGDGISYISLWNHSLATCNNLKFKIWPETMSGSVFYIEKGEQNIDILIISGQLVALGKNYNGTCIKYECGCTLNQTWMSVGIGINNFHLYISIDDRIYCELKWVSLIKNLTYAPINIGKPSLKNGIAFQGYIENLTIASSSPINLEAANLQSFIETSKTSSSMSFFPSSETISELSTWIEISASLDISSIYLIPSTVPNKKMESNKTFTSRVPVPDTEIKSNKILIQSFIAVGVIITIFLITSIILTSCFTVYICRQKQKMHTEGEAVEVMFDSNAAFHKC